MNEKNIKAPINDTKTDNPFKVTETEMKQLIEVETEIKDIINQIENSKIGKKIFK